MTDWIGRLWRGEVGLASAFWEYAVVFGTFANVVMTASAYGAFVAGAPFWLAVLIFFLAAPYTFLVTVGVWRSADRYQGPPKWAHAARIAVVVWAIAALVL
jgi:heme/copper-type cytochrome/quinol oxidase subunit 2